MEQQVRCRAGQVPGLVTWQLEYPALPGRPGAALDRLAARQEALARRLAPAARRERDLTRGLGFEPYAVTGAGQLAFSGPGVFSCRGDLLLRTGLRGRALAPWSLTLDRRTGAALPLGRFYPGDLSAIPAALEPQAEAVNADGCSLWRDWRQRLRTAFRPERFYLTEGGIVLWYPVGALGPAAAGAPAFLLPAEKLTVAARPEL